MTLKRLGLVYDLMEEMHSLQASLAAAEVREVESAIRAETNTLAAAWEAGRNAMHGDDLLGRSALAVREELANHKNRQLEPILGRRREVREQAQIRYRDSRLWSERMKTLVDAEMERMTVEEEHRMQAASDDRFLAQMLRKSVRDRL